MKQDTRVLRTVEAAAQGFYRRYEEAGIPYGRTWGGLEKWLAEQPHGAFGSPLNVWLAVKARMSSEMALRGYPA